MRSSSRPGAGAHPRRRPPRCTYCSTRSSSVASSGSPTPRGVVSPPTASCDRSAWSTRRAAGTSSPTPTAGYAATASIACPASSRMTIGSTRHPTSTSTRRGRDSQPRSSRPGRAPRRPYSSTRRSKTSSVAGSARPRCWGAADDGRTIMRVAGQTDVVLARRLAAWAGESRDRRASGSASAARGARRGAHGTIRRRRPGARPAIVDLTRIVVLTARCVSPWKRRPRSAGAASDVLGRASPRRAPRRSPRRRRR